MIDPSAIDPTDPVFISYRQSDGTAIAAELAWLLRAAGVPVWRDRDDLPPGDTEERLAQAIGDGLSGAVLVITPEIVKSEVVKTVEAPRLIRLHETHPAFGLAIANSVERAPGKVDYTAADRLLELTPGTLEGTDQKATDREGLRALVRGLVWHRAAEHRPLVAANAATFQLSLQTRNVAQVFDRTGGQLDLRVRPSSHERQPDAEGLKDLQTVIGLLPDAVTRTGARRVLVTGGAHLSVAFAVGAALPSSRVGQLDVVDQREQTWASGAEAVIAEPAMMSMADAGTGRSSGPTAKRSAVAVYLDLLPERSDAAFERFIEERGADLAAWQHIVSANPGLLQPAQAAGLAGEAAARIRALSADHDNATVHLLLRCPFPLAVLVGRLANTLRVTLYEWDDADPSTGDDFRPRFVATMNVRASAPEGAIADVLS